MLAALRRLFAAPLFCVLFRGHLLGGNPPLTIGPPEG